MCGRFAIGEAEGEDWQHWLDPDPDPDWPLEDWPSGRWNIAPTEGIGMLRLHGGRRKLSIARWGLVPHWWRKPLSVFRMSTFNARSEEAAGKPAFRDSWARHRCVIPAIGYYEWTGGRGAKTPWFVTMRRNTPGFFFAGLWAEAMIGGERLLSCTILTTEANRATRHLHPRSPVVLGEEDVGSWLSGRGDPSALMRPIPDERVEFWEVDARVGQVRNDGPELIERAGLAI